MKFEIKIILAFTVVMILILFYLNTVVINFFDNFREDFVKYTDERRILNREFIEEKFREYLKDVFLWEVLLVLSMTFILYRLIYHITNREREYSNLLKILLLTISHKFGNFLAIQKGNIDILKIRYDKKALERLENNYIYLKEDFERILNTIRQFKSFFSEKEKINLRIIIENIVSLFDFKGKLRTNLRDVQIYSNKQIVDHIVFSLLENAFKYSKEIVNMRLTKKYLAIRNDISEQEEKGSGVGLEIAKALAKKEGFQLKYKAKQNYFLALLKLKNKI